MGRRWPASGGQDFRSNREGGNSSLCSVRSGRDRGALFCRLFSKTVARRHGCAQGTGVGAHQGRTRHVSRVHGCSSRVGKTHISPPVRPGDWDDTYRILSGCSHCARARAPRIRGTRPPRRSPNPSGIWTWLLLHVSFARWQDWLQWRTGKSLVFRQLRLAISPRMTPQLPPRGLSRQPFSLAKQACGIDERMICLRISISGHDHRRSTARGKLQ